MKTIIIIPARGGSKGLPRKNVKVFNGKPLIAWTIEQAKQSMADKVVVSTEDKEIKEISSRYDVEVNDRPIELAQDDSPIYDTILYTLNYYEKKGEIFDIVVLCEPTKPLREVKDINTAITLISTLNQQSVVSIIKAESNNPDNFFNRKMNGLLEKDNYSLKQRQLLRDVYYPEGTIYASRVDKFRDEKTFYHNETHGLVVGKYKAIEIDDLSDFIAAEAIMKYYFPHLNSNSLNETMNESTIQQYMCKNRKYGL